MNNNDLLELLKRDSINIFSIKGLEEKINNGKKLRIKLGADPSKPDLHLGHSVILRKLRLFQELGHDVIFVIGDFTGMIGDPTGKNKTRPTLTLEETRKNGETYFEQVTKILDPNRTIIKYNSEWLDKLKFNDIINLTSKYTVARILERNDFSIRYHQNQSIGLHEMLYPLIQGYDSVALRANIEVGGTDQVFNLLVGRELQKDYQQEPQEVITFPLLRGLDGVEKMSKSLNNYISINESPHVMFEKCMKIPDHILLDYFQLTIDFDFEEAKNLIETDIRKAHYIYANEIVSLYHSKDEAINAEKKYKEITLNIIPSELNSIEIDYIKDMTLINVIRILGFATSNNEAKKLIIGKGIKINNIVIEDPFYKFTTDENVIISKGKSNYIRIIFNRIKERIK